MDKSQIQEYISALVDKEIFDLSHDEVDFLQTLAHERP